MPLAHNTQYGIAITISHVSIHIDNFNKFHTHLFSVDLIHFVCCTVQLWLDHIKPYHPHHTLLCTLTIHNLPNNYSLVGFCAGGEICSSNVVRQSVLYWKPNSLDILWLHTFCLILWFYIVCATSAECLLLLLIPTSLPRHLSVRCHGISGFR